MDVELYDRRTRTTRRRDVPTDRRARLYEEVTLSRWTRTHGEIGVWAHEVYRQTGQTAYEFIGMAPSAERADGDDAMMPLPVTVPWP